MEETVETVSTEAVKFTDLLAEAMRAIRAGLAEYGPDVWSLVEMVIRIDGAQALATNLLMTACIAGSVLAVSYYAIRGAICAEHRYESEKPKKDAALAYWRSLHSYITRIGLSLLFAVVLVGNTWNIVKTFHPILWLAREAIHKVI